AHPALGRLLDRMPGRQIVGHHPPRTAGADKPPQAVEQLAEWVVALGRSFVHQRQIRGAERPFVVADIAGITLAWDWHPDLFTETSQRCQRKILAPPPQLNTSA